ncbi:aldo/keto reductase [Methylobacterium sp. 77]|uniref:aldo/keto reductase n=1 Tax=Methylobacterium sp. 77 TaxID=1101192 RepID=UPI000374A7F7|nr:aldo/keto reductase [Methylobacterium sp. 77]
MQKRPLGTTGLTISAPGLGCMGMSEFYGPTEDTASLATLSAALDIGYDFLDTADTYGLGHNEELLGTFLKHRRDGIVLATKFGIVRDAAGSRRIDNTPAYVAAACDASLKRLRIETIDLYYCHRRNPETPLEETIGAMAKLVAAGKVRALGLSEVSPATLRAAHALHPIAAVQSEYSLWSREPEDGMLETCAELGVTFVAYSPLGRGFLTGAIDPEALSEGDFRKGNPRFQGPALAQNRRLADTLGTFATARGVTAAQVALAWLVTKAPNVVPIPGARRATRLAENAAGVDLALSTGDVAELDTLFARDAVAGARYAAGGTAGIEVI